MEVAVAAASAAALSWAALSSAALSWPALSADLPSAGLVALAPVSDFEADELSLFADLSALSGLDWPSAASERVVVLVLLDVFELDWLELELLELAGLLARGGAACALDGCGAGD